MRVKAIGFLDGIEITRIYAPHKRTVLILSKNEVVKVNPRLMEDDLNGNVIINRWEDKVLKFVKNYYFSFPWMIFHRNSYSDSMANLYIAFLKRFPKSLDEEVYTVALPNIDSSFLGFNCGASTLTKNIEIFWSSYFVMDEYPYGTNYAKLLFGYENYWDNWLKLEPEDLCQKLQYFPPNYSHKTLKDFLFNSPGKDFHHFEQYQLNLKNS